MMDPIRAKFVEEAEDLILELEKSILALEKTPDDHLMVENSFRAMHTLKGSGAMFGFELISQLTHDLETIYDFVREGKISISSEILNITLLSVDQLKVLLHSNEELNSEERKGFDELSDKVGTLINELSLKNSPSQPLPNVAATPKSEKNTTFYIVFKPGQKILRDGTNPLYLLEDLCNMGDYKVISHRHNIPNIEAIDELDCYVFWEIYLATIESEQAIQDVFMFISGDSSLELHKLSETNLFTNPQFEEKLRNQDTGEIISLEDLKLFVSDLQQSTQHIEPREQKREVVLKETNSSSIRVPGEKLDRLMNLISELITTQAGLNLLAEKTADPKLVSICENLQKISRQLRDNAFSICLIPIDSLTNRYNRMVRDLSLELNKEARFLVEGGDTELEKSVIEALNEPLLHILRNSIDHGIESVDQRKRLDKPIQGTILFKAYYYGHHVFIEIADDGAGINIDKVRKKAISKGLISEEAVLSEKEMLDLVFSPGFSTAEKVTGVSGRGVGMDVVKKKIQELRGEISMTSSPTIGSTITIKLPLTLSIIDGLLVQVADTFFIIPLTVIDKCYEVSKNQISESYNNLVVLDGEKLPYLNLREEFGLSGEIPEINLAVVVEYNHQKIGIMVDSIIGEHQAVLKPLGKFYKNQDLLSGASILGDGTVALVIDTNRMINLFENEATTK